MKKAMVSFFLFLVLASASLAATGASSWATNGSNLYGNNWYGGYGLADGSGGMYFFVSDPTGSTTSSPVYSSRFTHINSDGSVSVNQEIDHSLPSGIGSRFLAATPPAGKIAVMDSTQPIVAWARIPNVSGTSTKELYIEKFDSGGNYLWNNPAGPQLVTSTTALGNNITDFIVETDTVGGAYVIYISENKVYLRHVDSGGVVGSQIRVTDEGSAPINNILSMKGGSNYVWVVWQTSKGGGLYAINAAKVNISAPVATIVTIYPIIPLSDTVKFGGYPYQSICSDGSEGFVLVWSEKSRSGNEKTNVYMQWIEQDGTMRPKSGNQGTGIFVDQANDQRYPIIDMIDSDHFLIACASTEGNTAINIYGSVAQKSTLSINWLKKLSTSGAAAYPSICPDGSGNAFISYLDGRNEPDATKLANWFYNLNHEISSSDWTANADIYAKRIDGSGNDLWSQGDIPLCRAANVQFPTQIVNVETGKAAVHWMDMRDSATNESYIIGHTSAEAQQLIFAGSSLYAAKIADGSAPVIALNTASGIPYTSGMQVLQDAPCTLEGTVTVSDSTFSNNYSTMKISWDLGAAETVGFTSNSTNHQADYTHQKTLTGGTHSLTITATDDYGVSSSFSGSLVATDELVVLSDLYFDGSQTQCSTQPKVSVTVTVSPNLISVLDPTKLSFTTKWDGGTATDVAANTVTITKAISSTQAIFSFTNPTTLTTGQHTCLLTVKDNLYNNTAQVSLSVSVPSQAEYFAASTVIQNNQLTLTVRTAEELPANLSVSIISPSSGSSIVTLNASTAHVTSSAVSASAVGYSTYNWDIGDKLSNLPKGIYPVVLSTGYKTYLIKN